MKNDPGADAQKPEPAAGAAAVAVAEAEAIETAKLTGTSAALHFLRDSFDPDAHVLSSARPRGNSRTDDIAKVLVEIDGQRRVIMVESFEGGTFRLYAEIPHRGASEQTAQHIKGVYA